jgi:hypothetical protein
MGGVTGSVNAPVTQTTRNSASPADPAAQAEFGKTLEQEGLCRPGLHRPSRHDPPCTYLRPPSHPSQPSPPPADIRYKGDGEHLKGPMSGPKGSDYSKPPQLPSNDIKPPEGPGHNTGLGSGDGAHIGTWEWKI